MHYLPFSSYNTLPKNQNFDALVLDAQANQALVTIRSLGKKGLRVAAMGAVGKLVPAFSSKWCSLALISPAKEGTEGYANYLIAFLKQNKVGVIYTSSDGTVALLSKYRKKISKYANLALASDAALAIAVNKNNTLAVAKKLGIHIPQSYKVSKVEEIDNTLKHLSFPIVIKPSESWTENKKGTKRVAPELATTREEAFRIFHQLTEYGGNTLFQQYVSGRREALAVLYSKGKFYATFAQWTKRTQPPLGGTSVLRQSIEIPKDIEKQAKALIKEINLEGYSLVEFRRDAQGVPYLMEINPRLTVSIVLSYDVGIDFPYLMYLLTLGKKCSFFKRYKIGVWERHLAGDIINMVEAIQQHGRPGIPSIPKVITDFIITFFKPMHYDNVDFEDIRPAILATIDSVFRNSKRFF